MRVKGKGRKEYRRKKKTNKNTKPLWPDNVTLINTKNLNNQVLHIKTDCSFLD